MGGLWTSVGVVYFLAGEAPADVHAPVGGCTESRARVQIARWDALAEAPRVADRSAAVRGGTDTSRSALDGKGERAARRRG